MCKSTRSGEQAQLQNEQYDIEFRAFRRSNPLAVTPLHFLRFGFHIGQLSTWIAIASHATDSAVCWPRNKTIARDANVSDRTVSRITKELWSFGVLDIEYRTATQSLYRIVIDPDKIAQRKALRAGIVCPEEVTLDTLTPLTPHVTTPLTPHVTPIQETMQNTTPQKTNEETNARTRATPPQRSAPSKTGTSRTATSAVIEAQRERVDRYHLARGEDLSDVGENQRANESKLFADSRMPTDDIEPLMTYILSDGWWTPAKFSTGKFIELWIAWKAEGKPERKQTTRSRRDVEAIERSTEMDRLRSDRLERERKVRDGEIDPEPRYGVFAPGGMFGPGMISQGTAIASGNGAER